MTDPLDDQNARCDAKELIVEQGTQKLGSMNGVQNFQAFSEACQCHGRIAILGWCAGDRKDSVVLQSFRG